MNASYDDDDASITVMFEIVNYRLEIFRVDRVTYPKMRSPLWQISVTNLIISLLYLERAMTMLHAVQKHQQLQMSRTARAASKVTQVM